MPLFGISRGPAIEKLKAKRDVRGLIKALGYEKDSTVREAAVGALVELGDELTVSRLSEALTADNWFVVIGAARALGQIGDPRAIEPLVTVLRKLPVWDAKKSIQEALVRFGAPAVEPLIAALRAGYAPGGAPVDPRLATSDDANVRASIAKVLAEIGDARAVLPLSQVLYAPGVESRDMVIETALGKIGFDRAVEPLSAALAADEAPTRLAAVLSLAELGGARALPQVLAALKDSDASVRMAAAEALSGIGDARAIGPLTAARRRASDSGEREFMAMMLDELRELSDEVHAPKSKASSDPVRQAVEDLLHGSADAASGAVQRLGMLGDAEASRAVELLLEVTGDSGMRQRLALLKARGEWRESDAGLLLVELARRALESRGLLR